MGKPQSGEVSGMAEEAHAASCSPSSTLTLALPVRLRGLWAIPFQGSFRRVGIPRICPAIWILLSVGGMSKMEHFRLKFQTLGCKLKSCSFLRSLLGLTQGLSNISTLMHKSKWRSLCHALLFIPLLIIKLLFRIWEVELLLDHCRFM